MRHKFISTEGFEDECAICCLTESEHPSQVYNGMYVMPIYTEMQVSMQDLKPANEAMKLVMMFAGTP